MRTLQILSAALLLTACGHDPVQPTQKGWQGFTLGTMPLDVARKNEKRFLVSVPSRYIDNNWLPAPLYTDDSGRIVANAIRFGVKYPSLEPADDPWAKGAIRLTIGNMVEDGISSTVDGSRLNYYSGYSVPLPDAYGLHARKRGEYDPLGNRLFFLVTPELHVRIECKGNVNEKDKWCVFTARRPGEPILETGFYSAELPYWRERLSRLMTLFRSEGKEVLQRIHKVR